MSKQLEIRRHVDADDDVLTAAGVRAAVRLGDRSTSDYAVVVTSGAQRATQTAACFLAGLGRRVPGGVVVDPGLRSDREDEWRDAYREAGRGDLDAFRSVAPDLVASDSEALGAALGRVLDRIRDGDTALVIGHSPTNEAAVCGLTGEDVDPLGKGEGVLVTVDGDDHRIERLDA